MKYNRESDVKEEAIYNDRLALYHKNEREIESSNPDFKKISKDICLSVISAYRNATCKKELTKNILQEAENEFTTIKSAYDQASLSDQNRWNEFMKSANENLQAAFNNARLISDKVELLNEHVKNACQKIETKEFLQKANQDHAFDAMGLAYDAYSYKVNTRYYTKKMNQSLTVVKEELLQASKDL